MPSSRRATAGGRLVLLPAALLLEGSRGGRHVRGRVRSLIYATVADADDADDGSGPCLAASNGRTSSGTGTRAGTDEPTDDPPPAACVAAGSFVGGVSAAVGGILEPTADSLAIATRTRRATSNTNGDAR